MNRQVDVKALVSHIVRGDGLEKCRICLGDTSQGQVHLGDTVMMDGDKPVTLSELLAVITGVEVLTDEALPPAICLACSEAAIQVAGFRTLVQNADHQWMNMLQLLEHLPDYKYSKTSDRICVLLSNNDIYISDEGTKPPSIQMEMLDEQNFPLRRVGKQHDCICPICGKKFIYPQHLYKHLKESADLLRACHICAEIMSRDDLVLHLSEKHETEPFSCKKCPALFLNGRQYKEHLLIAHAPGSCTCGDCGRTFQSKPAFHAHQSVHTLRFCPNCDTQFRNQACYFYHVKKCCNIDSKSAKKSKITVTLHKKQNKKFKMGLRGSANKECICDYCNKKFAGKKFVAAHIQIVHTKDTHRPCVYCGKLFAAAYMTTHIKCHTQQAFECHQCGVILKSKLGFNQHLRLHTGERPYPCHFCEESFSASSRRSEHIRNTHKKSEIVLKHVCELCPARFRLPHKLKQHVKAVHGDSRVDESWYKCGVCKEKFASCRSLLYHSRKHNKAIEETPELPPSLCRECTTEVISAAMFKQFCQQSAQCWNNAIIDIKTLHDPTDEDKTFFIFVTEDRTIYNSSEPIATAENAAAILNKPSVLKKKKKKSRVSCNCVDCGKVFNSRENLNEHLRFTLFRVCLKCGVRMNKKSLAKHLADAHGLEFIDCRSCCDLFSNHVEASRHWMKSHGSYPHSCNVCGSSFANLRGLRAHNTLHALYRCSCGASFENNRCYQYHLTKCKSGKTKTDSIFKCDHCGVQYDKKPSLITHVIQKHMNVLPYVCQTCGKRTSTLSHLKSHQAVHEPERLIMKCYCGAEFRTTLGYKLHMKIHSGDKPYKCEHCEESFLSASRRLDHVKRRHYGTKDMSHGCTKCGAKFIRPWELKKHYLNAHSSVVDVQPLKKSCERFKRVKTEI